MQITHHFLGKEYNFSKNSTKYSQLESELKKNQIIKGSIFLVNQIHGSTAIEVTKENLSNNLGAIEADSMVTKEINVSLIIVTADCAPILLFDQENFIIGAVHAGWRGAKSGVISNAVKKMKSLGAKNIQAVIGPTIRQESYEVQNDFYKSFNEDSANYKKFFTKNSNQLFFNLPEFVKEQLTISGVHKITDQTIDTLTSNNFYSYRQSTINQTPNDGRNLSIITISK